MKNLLFTFTASLLLIFILDSCNYSSETPASKNQESKPEKVSQNLDQHKDFESVQSAILDYVEGIYEVDSTRIERSVHPELRKRGYWYNEEKSEYVNNLDMTFDQLVHLAATWNGEGKKASEESPKKIEIYDISDKTASAKLTAEWGIDYFHLAKMEGKWQIVNVLWQSAPRKNGKS